MQQPKEIDKRNHLAEERTKLAAERTFLAWIRTGMTSIGIGIAIARFIIFRQIEHQQIGHFLGQLLILWGICIFILALVSYSRTVRQFKPAYVDLSFIGLVIVTFLLILVCSILFWIIVK